MNATMPSIRPAPVRQSITVKAAPARAFEVFTKDIAETKATRATEMAQSKGYPLQFITEPEE